MARYEARLLPAGSILHVSLKDLVRGSGGLSGGLDDAHEVVDMEDGRKPVAWAKGATAARLVTDALNAASMKPCTIVGPQLMDDPAAWSGRRRNER